MLTFLCMDFIELVYIYLLHAQLLLTRCPQMWRKDYKSFYCRSVIVTWVQILVMSMLSMHGYDA